MAFREHDGFRITSDPIIRTPKGKLPRQRTHIKGGFIRGDRIVTTEKAIWLNPRYRTETRSELFGHLGKGGTL